MKKYQKPQLSSIFINTGDIITNSGYELGDFDLPIVKPNNDTGAQFID